MDFNTEMNSISNQELKTNNFINKPGIERVIIKDYQLVSPENRTPYLELNFETDNDEKLTLKQRFYRVKQGDLPSSAEWKQERIKRVLANAGCNFELTGEEVIKSALNKPFNVLFKESEYIGYNKDLNNKPEIKTKIEYSFSEPINKEITGNQSYFYSKLRDTDQAKFEGELLMWNRDNNREENKDQLNSNNSIPSISEDDMF
jgi:hypothetical protein